MKKILVILSLVTVFIISGCSGNPQYVLNAVARDTIFSIEPRGANYTVIYLTHADDAFCIQGKSTDVMSLIDYDGEVKLTYHSPSAMTGDSGCETTENEGTVIYVVDSFVKVPQRNN